MGARGWCESAVLLCCEKGVVSVWGCGGACDAPTALRSSLVQVPSPYGLG